MPPRSMTASRPRTKAPPKWITRDLNREARIQAACVEYVRLVAPQVTILHVPNGGPGRSLSRLVWMGMIVGFTDLILIDEHCLVYVAEVKDADSPLGDDQIIFRDYCRARKIPWALWRSVNDAANSLAAWAIKTRESRQIGRA